MGDMVLFIKVMWLKENAVKFEGYKLASEMGRKHEFLGQNGSQNRNQNETLNETFQLLNDFKCLILSTDFSFDKINISTWEDDIPGNEESNRHYEILNLKIFILNDLCARLPSEITVELLQCIYSKE